MYDCRKMVLHAFNGNAFFHTVQDIAYHVLVRIHINTGDRGVTQILGHAVEISDDHIQFILRCQFPVFFGEGSLSLIQIHIG